MKAARSTARRFVRGRAGRVNANFFRSRFPECPVTDPAVTMLPPDDGSWLKTLKAEVQPMTFKKGRQYAEARRVSGLSRTDVGIAATVTGSEGQKYAVQLAPTDDGAIESMCNCESWNKYGAHCKHVVAAGPGVPGPGARAGRGRRRPRGAGQHAKARPPKNDTTVPERADRARALAKLENWLGLSALPDLEFHYRLTPTQLRHRQPGLDHRRAPRRPGGQGPGAGQAHPHRGHAHRAGRRAGAVPAGRSRGPLRLEGRCSTTRSWPTSST